MSTESDKRASNKPNEVTREQGRTSGESKIPSYRAHLRSAGGRNIELQASNIGMQVPKHEIIELQASNIGLHVPKHEIIELQASNIGLHVPKHEIIELQASNIGIQVPKHAIIDLQASGIGLHRSTDGENVLRQSGHGLHVPSYPQTTGQPSAGWELRTDSSESHSSQGSRSSRRALDVSNAPASDGLYRIQPDDQHSHQTRQSPKTGPLPPHDEADELVYTPAHTQPVLKQNQSLYDSRGYPHPPTGMSTRITYTLDTDARVDENRMHPPLTHLLDSSTHQGPMDDAQARSTVNYPDIRDRQELDARIVIKHEPSATTRRRPETHSSDIDFENNFNGHDDSDQRTHQVPMTRDIGRRDPTSLDRRMEQVPFDSIAHDRRDGKSALPSKTREPQDRSDGEERELRSSKHFSGKTEEKNASSGRTKEDIYFSRERVATSQMTHEPRTAHHNIKIDRQDRHNLQEPVLETRPLEADSLIDDLQSSLASLESELLTNTRGQSSYATRLTGSNDPSAAHRRPTVRFDATPVKTELSNTQTSKLSHRQATPFPTSDQRRETYASPHESPSVEQQHQLALSYSLSDPENTERSPGHSDLHRQTSQQPAEKSATQRERQFLAQQTTAFQQQGGAGHGNTSQQAETFYVDPNHNYGIPSNNRQINGANAQSSFGITRGGEPNILITT